jgi:ELWxxDGT repeat protein
MNAIRRTLAARMADIARYRTLGAAADLEAESATVAAKDLNLGAVTPDTIAQPEGARARGARLRRSLWSMSSLGGHRGIITMSKLVFEGVDSNGDDELFISNSTGGNITEIPLSGGGVQNGGILGNGSGADGPELLTLNGSVYLQEQDATGALGLFVYNGSTLKEVMGVVGTGFAANDYGLDPQDLVAYNGQVYFNGYNENLDRNLWTSNGTTAGTHEITGSPANPTDMAVYNGALYMNAEGGDGESDFISYNGSSFKEIQAGLDPTDITAAAYGDHYGYYSSFGGLLPSGPPTELFMNGIEGGKSDLFVYNGSGSPTEINAAKAGSAGLNPQDITAMSSSWLLGSYVLEDYQDNAAYFSGVDNTGKRGLWVSQGTAATTTEIAGTSGLSPYDLTALNGDLYFTGNDGSARGLFVYNPENNKVTELVGPHASNSANQGYDLYDNYNNNGTANFGNLNPPTMTALGGTLYFGASHNGASNYLYDVTLGGTAASPTATVNLVSTKASNPTSLTTV